MSLQLTADQLCGARRSGLDEDDDHSFCVPAEDSTLVKINGCFSDDEDWDGQSYRLDWPGTDPNSFADRQLHPTPVKFARGPRRAAPAGTLASMEERLVAVVEIPMGCSNKYEWDAELGAIKLDRLLFSSLGYPTDYGFLMDTVAADGDPLDAMIAVSAPTFPGCRIEVKPVALFRMRDQRAEDNKVLCVPYTDPNWSHIETLDDLPMTLRDEISHFFSIYKTPEWKVVKVDGWFPREEALKSIERARKRWREQQEAG